MKKTILLLAVFGLVFSLTSCKDDEETKPRDAFDGTSWMVSLVDPNPSTSTELYYPWKNCNLDDVLTFKDGKVTIDNGGTVCDSDDLISFITGQTYTYDSSAKTLTIALFKADVKEFTSTDLKIIMELPGVLEPTTFMFKKK